jgi:hypothetical protein
VKLQHICDAVDEMKGEFRCSVAASAVHGERIAVLEQAVRSLERAVHNLERVGQGA